MDYKAGMTNATSLNRLEQMAHPHYYVSKVSYNSSDTHIDYLLTHKMTADNNMESEQLLTRTEVVKLIKNGKTFMTMTIKDGKWVVGAPINIIRVETDFLKTSADKTDIDNLENLPRIK